MLLLIAVGFGAATVRVLMAAEYAASNNPELWRRAAQLEPDNAAYWAKLGSVEEWDFERDDLGQAASDYERAVEANPRSDRYWMELAAIYERQGKISQARAAHEQAQLNHPISSEVSWRFGNFLLRQGTISEACVQFRKSLLADPELTEGIVAACWKTKLYTLQAIAEFLPPQNRYYFKALDYLGRQNEMDAAFRVWDGLLALGRHFELAQALPLINDAMFAGRVKEAQRVWRQAIQASGWPQEAKEDFSLIFNGGFEHDFADGGFDWRKQEDPDCSFGFDAGVAHSGARSLRISFDGRSNLDFQHLIQYVPVVPTHHYRFTAYLRSSAVSTDSGMRFMIADPLHPNLPQLFTAGVIGTQPWTRIQSEFMTGPETQLVSIVLRRTPSTKFDNKLKGVVWVDDVMLQLATDSEENLRP